MDYSILLYLIKRVKTREQQLFNQNRCRDIIVCGWIIFTNGIIAVTINTLIYYYHRCT